MVSLQRKGGSHKTKKWKDYGQKDAGPWGKRARQAKEEGGEKMTQSQRSRMPPPPPLFCIPILESWKASFTPASGPCYLDLQ